MPELLRYTPLLPGTNRPFLTNWPRLATHDRAQLEQWSVEFPGCNWGIVTGNGVGVLDLDTKKAPEDSFGGYATLIHVEEELGIDLSNLPVVETASGAHLYFRYDGILPSKVPWLPYLDVMADGGHQVAAPGTVRTDTVGETRVYRLVRGDLEEIPHAPEALVKAIRSWRMTRSGGYTTAANSLGGELLSTEEAITNGLPPGQRNDLMHRLACRWFGMYEDGAKVRDLAFEVWQATADHDSFSWPEALVAVSSAERFMNRQKDKSIEEIIAMLGLNR